MALRNTPRLAFIGFGEAGQAIAAGLREAGVESVAALGHPVSAKRRCAAERGRRKDGRAACDLGGRCGARQ